MQLFFMRYWSFHSKIFPVIFVCPDEQTFPGHRKSAVDAGQKKKVNCRQMWENFRLQVPATFCILQVPYGKSKYKTVLWYLHILQSFILYSTVFIIEFDSRCLSFRANAAPQWKLDSAVSSESALVSMDQIPSPQTSQGLPSVLHPKGCFVQFIK